MLQLLSIVQGHLSRKNLTLLLDEQLEPGTFTPLVLRLYRRAVPYRITLAPSVRAMLLDSV